MKIEKKVVDRLKYLVEEGSHCNVEYLPVLKDEAFYIIKTLLIQEEEKKQS